MNDEELYLKATNEVEGDSKDPALWAKVMALAGGDQDKAKYQYIKFRVEQLAKSKSEKKTVFSKKIIDQFTLEYMPVSEFSMLESIPEKEVIDGIRDGIYVGQIKGNEWFIHRDKSITGGAIVHESPSSKTPKDTAKKFIPLEEFAEHKGITPEKIIEMIRDGLCEGQIIDDKWHVAYSEIDKTTESNSPKRVGGLFHIFLH